MTWQLFIDESGNFDDSSDTCVVGGVLVHANEQGRDASVRAALMDAAPGARYPYHASAARSSSGRVYATITSSRDNARGGEDEKRLAREAVALFTKHASRKEAHSLLDAIERKKEPQHAVLRDCDLLLGATAPELAGQLAKVVEQDKARVRQVLQHSAELFGASDTEGAIVVAAIDEGELDDRDVDDATIERDRYLALLAVLLERVSMLLHGCAASVWYFASTRYVTRRDVGTFPLDNANLQAATRLANEFPLRVAEPRQAPRLINGGRQQYNATVRPGLVLADFASNAIRGSVKNSRPDLGWGRLARNIERRLALDVEATPRLIGIQRRLPAISSAGPARTVVFNAFSGVPINANTGPRKTWARDQARMWSEAGSAWRATKAAP
jgi:hypothetical protein